jgi:hypothetical protein
MKKGETVTVKDLYSAIPYQKEINHITSREYFDNEFVIVKDVSKDSPLTQSDIS